MLLMFPGISRQSLFRSDWLMDWITCPIGNPLFHLCRNADEQRRYAIRLINLAQVMVGRVPGSLVM